MCILQFYNKQHLWHQNKINKLFCSVQFVYIQCRFYIQLQLDTCICRFFLLCFCLFCGLLIYNDIRDRTCPANVQIRSIVFEDLYTVHHLRKPEHRSWLVDWCLSFKPLWLMEEVTLYLYLDTGFGFPRPYVVFYMCIQWIELRGSWSFCWYW
jgi:hypothetical protein